MEIKSENDYTILKSLFLLQIFTKMGGLEAKLDSRKTWMIWKDRLKDDVDDAGWLVGQPPGARFEWKWLIEIFIWETHVTPPAKHGMISSANCPPYMRSQTFLNVLTIQPFRLYGEPAKHSLNI